MIKLFVHTIFILRENIFFLEEWLDYHILLGVDHFYLYDNSKSIGRNGSTTTTNKYKYNFFNLTSHISDDEICKMLANIVAKYKEYVTVIDWNPRNENNETFYGQNESILHHILNTSFPNTWTAFIDIDEFIYSRISLKKLISVLDYNDCSDIILLQKKFDDRFNNLGTPVTRIFKCIEGVDTSKWAPKHIIKNVTFDVFLSKDLWNIHYLPLVPDYNIYCDESKENLRFNHYNTNETVLKWMKGFYGTEKEFEFNGECTDLCDIYEQMKSDSFNK